MSDALPCAKRVRVPVEKPPSLFVVVDTEEEFDWSAPYSRAHTAVSAMAHIGRVQGIFDRFGIVPTYVIDYPVVSQPDGYGPLLELARDGRCTVGAHLHPWVNPPYSEEVSRRNSFMMNLSTEQQRSKLDVLFGAIGERFGSQPLVFKAGRYGIGRQTVALLEELGVLVDVSVCPRMDFSAEDGPSFAGFDSAPFLLTEGLLELPCTVDYTGWAGPLRPGMHRIAARDSLAVLRLVGIMARLRATNQIMLSPEGNTLDEMRRLAAALCARGCRTFTLSFHSPSVVPGHTPYVRTHEDLSSFLFAIEGFCEFFMSDLGGTAATPLQFRTNVMEWAGTV